MHKSERLFQLVNVLKGRRLAMTAQQLAAHFCVSERTIYRDIQHLQCSGVPIEGEAGIGYLIADHALPPMMFNVEELSALLLGSKMVGAWTDPTLSEHARSAMAKIEAVLPDHLKQSQDSSPYLVSSFSHNEKQQQLNKQCREAIESKQCLQLSYCDVNHTATQRQVEPLGLVYWGGKWTLVAFCLLRLDYREFRIDRIQSAHTLDVCFEPHSEKSLSHYVALVTAKYANCSNNK
ncbi:DNA-binding transcriptional regulator [Pseudoalteromonas citrea]|uniref:DNA-binding transcriptional regulator n=1 Tax=Pseudoalteromonas citrea TaxID=43655 RepID=A0A5S3XR06_9GAMM|nr:YafY family protein [Pseudoalteromonas citrea]TMP38811.1 DNA-binding transcriptional regulator [Pseudoalteromonas citrea]TMP60123.1 DNA-binding transcriptional regulator [Pseudoalteromonas citrea]